MLDDDNTPTQVSDAPAPRRRRAASRPAGPPAPVIVNDTAPEPVDQVVEPVDQAPAEPVTEEPVKPVRARRTRRTAEPVVEPVAEPIVSEPVVEEPRDAAPDEQLAEEATASVAAEAPIELPAAEPEEPAAEEVLAEEIPAEEPPAEEPPAEELPPEEAEDEVVPPQDAWVLEPVEGAPADEQPAVEPLSLDALPRLEEIAPDEQRGGRRRRRPAKETVVPPVEETPEGDNPLGESLDELAKAAPRRRGGWRTPAVDTAAALDELAAAIGGGVNDEDGSDDEETDDDAALDETLDAEDGEDGDSPRRRRRRRGGRRRRRGGTVELGSDEAEEADEPADEAEEGDSEAEATDEAEAAAGSSSSRRRRRRRRRGEEVGVAEDDPSDVVIRVREPRRARPVSDEVTGIEGSTRMEAKRQRRREGRAAGRRRTPILSEAEFLARREAVDRSMLIRQADDYTQIGVLEDGVLVEHYVDRASATSLIGNIYLGKVQNVLPSMEAAFIDIGRGRNAVLYAGEVDWDAYGATGGERKMERVFKSGQSVLVQVSKDPVGAKGARLTGHVSIPGRYVVYSPGGQLSGISRKLPEGERARLKGILDDLLGESASVIVRTAAEGATEDELVRDVNRLKAQWEIIEKKVKAGKSPELLYAEPDLTVRIVRDLFTEDFGKLVIDGNGRGEDAWDSVSAYVSHVAPHLAERMVHWNREESGDLFGANRIDEQIAKALERKVFLPSGGSLVIDRTEAMTVIDVNTGKFTGTSGNLEATVTSNNLEAAEEVVRQLRLRDIGGIIVIDFIDMVLPANRELLLRRLVECLGRDRTRHQVAEVTSLGLVQMTRKKIGTGLAEAFTVSCETCHGRGYHRHDTPIATQAPADGGEREHGRRRR